MDSKKFACLVVLLAAAALASCSLLPKELGLNTSAGSQVLFADGFANPDSGWSTWNNEDSTVSYQDGGLRILIRRPHYDFWSRPARRFADTRIEVDARRLAGPENNDFGILCRYRSSENFYAFLISSDQYYGILRVQDGQYTLLTGDEMQFSADIHPGDTANHLRGDCVGSDLRLYINGNLAAEVKDDTFDSGEVGLMAGSFDQPDVDVWFDNFIVLKP